MNLLKAIGLKVLSALLFAIMSALVRKMGQFVPVGEVVFFRSVFAIIPIFVIYAWRGELRGAVYTKRPMGQAGRGVLSVFNMFANFSALARIPLADATAISFATPLATVAFAALILKERVRIYRWSAVAVGFAGVIVMLLPHLDIGRYAGAASSAATIGALLALFGAISGAGTIIQTRRLTESETTSSIVFYFSVICALAGAVTLPFAWYSPSPGELAIFVTIGMLGGIAHIFQTESYRFATASAIAPFDYTSLLWSFLLGYWMFGEVPTELVFIGAGIVAAAGLFVIWRERQLGLKRRRDAEGLPERT
jgi:drug/metabolite transporter (DMT)-like permease